MEDEPTSNDEEQAGKEHKVKRPAYMSLESNVKDVASVVVDGDMVDPANVGKDTRKANVEMTPNDKRINGEASVKNELDRKNEESDPEGPDVERKGTDVDDQEPEKPEEKVEKNGSGERVEREEELGISDEGIKESAIKDKNVKTSIKNDENLSEPDSAKEEDPIVKKEYGEEGTRTGGPEGKVVEEQERSDDTRLDWSPSWHDASRDWNICGGSTAGILIIFALVLYRLDVMQNDVVILFLGIFLAFIAIISLVFLIGANQMNDYHALFIFYKHDPLEFIRFLEKEIKVEHEIELKEIDRISGQTFGLLIPKRTWELSTGEILEVNAFKGPFASFIYGPVSQGMTLGLYFLIRASSDSPIWSILEGFIRKKKKWD